MAAFPVNVRVGSPSLWPGPPMYSGLQHLGLVGGGGGPSEYPTSLSHQAGYPTIWLMLSGAFTNPLAYLNMISSDKDHSELTTAAAFSKYSDSSLAMISLSPDLYILSTFFTIFMEASSKLCWRSTMSLMAYDHFRFATLCTKHAAQKALFRLNSCWWPLLKDSGISDN